MASFFDFDQQPQGLFPQLAAPPLPMAGPSLQMLGASFNSPGFIDDAELARQAAAARLQRSVQPPGGRQEGGLTKVLANYVPHLAGGFKEMAQQAFEESERLRLAWQYDAGPAVGAALMTMGATPFSAPRGALGAGPVPRLFAPGEQIRPGDLRVSTRFPSGATASENPLTEHLLIGAPEIISSPVAQHNTAILSSYPGMAHLRGMSPEQTAQAYMEAMRGNLNFLYEQSPQVMRERSPLWYEGANRLTTSLAERHGVPIQSEAAAIAAMSPQKDWFQNASLAERLGDILTGPEASKRFTSDMQRVAESRKSIRGSEKNTALLREIQGNRLVDLTDPDQMALWIRLRDEAYNPPHFRNINPEGELGDFVRAQSGEPWGVGWGSIPEISKAVRAMQSGGDMNVISPLLGERHKVRNFYNNIIVPHDPRFGDVTGDTHAMAASLLRPLAGSDIEVAHNFANYAGKGNVGAASSAPYGVQGTYGFTADATRMAAADQGLIPRGMQSATWEPVRTMFENIKTAKGKQAVDDIWRAVDRGELSPEQARQRIFEYAGGVRLPEWAQPGAVFSDPRGLSTYR